MSIYIKRYVLSTNLLERGHNQALINRMYSSELLSYRIILTWFRWNYLITGVSQQTSSLQRELPRICVSLQSYDYFRVKHNFLEMQLGDLRNAE